MTNFLALHEPHVSSGACRRWLAAVSAAIVTAALVWLAHGPGFQGTFVYDDLQEIVGNSALETLWPPWVPMFMGGGLPHRPLPYYSFAVNRILGGLDPWGYHAVNLALHLGNGILIWWIARRTLRRAHVAAADTIAWLGSLVWLVHPLSTQAVTYIYQRMELMAATCMLVTLACFIRSLDAPRSRLWRAAAIVSSCIGCLCKETAVATPLIVLLYDFCFGGSDGGTAGWRAIRSRLPMYVGLFGTWAVTIAVVAGQQWRFSEFVRPNYGPMEYAWTQPLVILRYLRLAVWPRGQCFDLDWPVARDPLIIAAGVTALAAIAGAVCAASAPRTGGIFLALGFLTLLAPTSSFVPVNYLYGEHRMYLPLAMLAVGLPLATVRAADRCRIPKSCSWLLAAAWVGLATGLAMRTADRNALYASRVDLWEDTVAVSPRNPTAALMLAGAQLAAGRPREALAAVERSLEIAPHLPFAHARRAEVFFDLGQISAAASAARRAIALQPRLPGAHVTLLAALLRDGQPSAAAIAGEEALAAVGDLVTGPGADPNAGSLFTTIGVAWAMTGDDRAEHAFARALELNKQSPQARYNLARMVWRKDPVRGLMLLDEAVGLDPEYAAADQLRREIRQAIGRDSGADREP